MTQPIDLSKGNHRVMYEPPNRGGKTYASLARFSGGNDPGAVIDPAVLANAFLMPRGYTMVWSGWDKSAGSNGANFNIRIGGPGGPGTPLAIAKGPAGATITGPAYEYIVTSGTGAFTLAYPAANPADKTTAVLTHRVHLDDEPVVVPASGWTYNAAGTTINLVPPGWVSQDIYEFSYTAKDPSVNGLGFAAVRDWNSSLKYELADQSMPPTPNPLAGDVQRIFTEISSQPGRMLNDSRHLGFNRDEGGRRVFDGLMQWIAAGDGINMNYRFSQPGRTERNRQDHLYVEGVFPFANVTTTDPFTHKTDSRLARCEATNTCPVAVEIYSANEFWVKAGSLMTTTPDGTADLPDSPFARNYLISSHQHGTGNANNKGNCQQFQNPLNSAPIQRALFIALDQWLDGTPQSAMGFPSIPNVIYTGLKTTRYLLDYGPTYYTDGIPTTNPPHVMAPYQDNPANGPIYPSFIPKTDADGNDIAGVRLPDVTVPLATYTGWALRAGPQANDGCESAGQYIPFARTQAQRLASGDPRASVEERYPSYAEYRSAVMRAVDGLVKDRFMLCEDADDALARLLQAGPRRGRAGTQGQSDAADDRAALPRQEQQVRGDNSMSGTIFGGRGRAIVAVLAAVVVLAWAPLADAKVTRIIIDQMGNLSADTSYVQLIGRAFGELDPNDSHNTIITDIGLATPNASGKVEYIASFALVYPKDAARNSRAHVARRAESRSPATCARRATWASAVAGRVTTPTPPRCPPTPTCSPRCRRRATSG